MVSVKDFEQYVLLLSTHHWNYKSTGAIPAASRVMEDRIVRKVHSDLVYKEAYQIYVNWTMHNDVERRDHEIETLRRQVKTFNLITPRQPA